MSHIFTVEHGPHAPEPTVIEWQVDAKKPGLLICSRPGETEVRIPDDLAFPSLIQALAAAASQGERIRTAVEPDTRRTAQGVRNVYSCGVLTQLDARNVLVSSASEDNVEAFVDLAIELVRLLGKSRPLTPRSMKQFMKARKLLIDNLYLIG